MRSLDANEVAIAVLNLLEDHKKRAELGRTAEATIRSQFAAEPVRRRYRQIAATFASPESHMEDTGASSYLVPETEVRAATIC